MSGRKPVDEAFVFLYGSIFVIVLMLATIAVSKNGVSDLYIPAMTTILGSFGLFIYQRKTDRRLVVNSLAAELEQMNALDDLPSRFSNLQNPPTKEKIPKDTVPSADSFPTRAYEANIGKLALLDQDLASEIVGFYSQLLRYKGYIQRIHRDTADGEDDDLPMDSHKELYEGVDDLQNKKDDILAKLK